MKLGSCEFILWQVNSETGEHELILCQVNSETGEL